ncbi:hypothetical protein HZS_569 [Henneguya salminicola]|nr:hypothetical protein HZS_569 [Henneguya salminicola]
MQLNYGTLSVSIYTLSLVVGLPYERIYSKLSIFETNVSSNKYYTFFDIFSYKTIIVEIRNGQQKYSVFSYSGNKKYLANHVKYVSFITNADAQKHVKIDNWYV